MRIVLGILTLFISFCLQAGEVLTATVARVKNHVVTTREVQMQNLFDKSLKSKSLIYHDKDPVEQLIREWLLYFEARSFYNSERPNDRNRQAVRQARTQLKKMKKWQRLQVTSAEFNEMVKRKREAQRLFLFKKEASILPVSDNEIESEYKQNRIRYGTLSFDQVKEKIRKKKTEENLKQRLDNWFEVLERKYRVQRFAKYDSGP